MKLYTKRGDFGNTNLVGGRTVPKDHPRVDAYGSLDELNSWIGYTISLIKEKTENEGLREELILIQHFLFDVGTALADPFEKLPLRISKEETSWLEEKIDQYEEQTPLIESFILPGGTQLASALQVARTTARKAERNAIFLQNQDGEEVPTDVKTFLNRLSDYFFAAARWVNTKAGIKEPAYERGGKVFHHSAEEKEKRSKK